MIYFEHVTLRRGKKVLFSDFSLTIHSKDKIGVTGANGTGKSSFFGLILGKLEEDKGQFRSKTKLTISHVAQETPALDMAAVDYVLLGDVELTSLQQRIADAEDKQDGILLSKLHERMDAIAGYQARARAGQLLNGLGFTTVQEGHVVSSFSGGWRMRLNLAQALMCRSDVLLLDEPTNHLDLEAVLWLEKWLKSYQGALLLISHDREFLDSTITSIAHIEQEKITMYAGNYTAFELRRAEQLALQQSSFEKQQREIAHMESFITRFKAKATKAKQAQSRIKALERMEKIAPAHVDSPFSFAFKDAGFMPTPLLQLQKVSFAYTDVSILEKISISLLPNDRIGLLGPNGAGKSTLIKLLAGESKPSVGQVILSKGVRIGYFAQHQLEQLDSNASPIQHLFEINPSLSEKEARLFLGGFNFHGDMALESIASFSGGEKARLVLAMLVYQQPNVLLMDEPTNHLDLDMRHALTLALQNFEGAMVLVSHDRHLLRTVCDNLWLVSGGKADLFSGDLDDYANWLNEQRLVEQQGDNANLQTSGEHTRDARKAKRKEEAEQRKALQPKRNQLKKLEQRLENLHSKEAELNDFLADSALYETSEKDRLIKLTTEHNTVKQELDEVEEAWVELSEELENL
ncbi:MAG TPA: ATP-binding cassette domain-containing protein [Ghiorsea sp.]|nr:ATP-binding cassette domain-containing protein [Ghiorsea sp.]HIP07218.1 ATP-binding cassette domain-containing protein [Mariprofundaceae bacterium]